MNNDEDKEVKIITENIKRDFGYLVRVLCLVGFTLFCDFIPKLTQMKFQE